MNVSGSRKLARWLSEPTDIPQYGVLVARVLMYKIENISQIQTKLINITTIHNATSKNTIRLRATGRRFCERCKKL